MQIPMTKSNTISDENETDSAEKVLLENISPFEGMYSTPLMGKSNQTRRIPLSVINRRGASADLTPLQLKNRQESYSIEKYERGPSLNKLEECRGSARKSKIPVYKK